MLTALDRLTIYSVLCFISFCALVMGTDPANVSWIPVIGMCASILGIWLEMRHWQGSSEEHQN